MFLRGELSRVSLTGITFVDYQIHNCSNSIQPAAISIIGSTQVEFNDLVFSRWNCCEALVLESSPSATTSETQLSNISLINSTFLFFLISPNSTDLLTLDHLTCQNSTFTNLAVFSNATQTIFSNIYMTSITNYNSLFELHTNNFSMTGSKFDQVSVHPTNGNFILLRKNSDVSIEQSIFSNMNSYCFLANRDEKQNNSLTVRQVSFEHIFSRLFFEVHAAELYSVSFVNVTCLYEPLVDTEASFYAETITITNSNFFALVEARADLTASNMSLAIIDSVVTNSDISYLVSVDGFATTLIERCNFSMNLDSTFQNSLSYESNLFSLHEFRWTRCSPSNQCDNQGVVRSVRHTNVWVNELLCLR